MLDRDLVVGVLAVQAGFATPTQVMSAASAGLIDRGGPALLARLEGMGALTPARRALLEAMADEALADAAGDAQRALERLGGEEAVLRTFGEGAPVAGPARSAIADAERLVPDERRGQYTRLGELGRGAQSVVRHALDEFIGREVALKELLPTPPAAEGADTSASRARFLQEARLTGQLDHPGIVAVHELARRPDGTLFCAQKLIRGETLKARLARCETLEQRLAVLPHVIDACQALAYAHSRGVIHRDIKPANIMAGAFGETVVVDWGLGKKRGEADPVAPARAGAPPDPGLSVAGVALGTPTYMSPEQARGAIADIDERSDVFSLGVILYQLLTGRVPFEGATVEQTIAKVLQGRFAPVRQVCPEAPPELAAVVERALDPDPANRYAGAEPLANELLAYRAGRRVAAYEYRSWDLVKKFVARNRAFSAASAAALLILVGSSIAIGYQLHLARLSLANSFLERARAAEQASDWARAAGYYAASRIENDSREGRWGYAMAHERMPRRVLSRHDEKGSFADVGFLPDGRALAVTVAPPWVIGREVENGRELWRFQPPEPVTRVAVIFDGQVRLSLQWRFTYLDGATGRVVAEISPSDPIPCGSSPAPARAVLTPGPDGGVLAIAPPAGERRTLVTGLGPLRTTLCEVSRDGVRLAVQDRGGVVHLWDLAKLEEVASRPAPDAVALHHTAHGVAIVRGSSIQIFGGPDGDYFVSIPGQRGSGLHRAQPDDVSLDGHLLVVARPDSNQADIVDLRVRRVVSSLSFAAGKPTFAFSPAGDRLWVAGLQDGSLLTAWDIRPPDASPSIAGERRMAFSLSQDGRRILVLLVGDTYRAALYDADGTRLRTFDIGAWPASNATLSADGKRIATSTSAVVSVIDADSGATISRLDCSECIRVDLSGDGRRLLTSNGHEVIQWDVDRGQSIWREQMRVGPVAQPLSVSPDGRVVLWGRDGSVYLHTEGGADQELQLGESLQDADFSYDGTRLAVVSARSIGVWEIEGLRPIFRVPNSSWVAQEIYWSRDDSALLNWRDGLGTLLLDSRTGARFATIDVARPAAFGTNEIVSPALDYRISRGDGAWQITPLPRPDDSTPERSLTRVLEEAGLEMRGVELTYEAPPGR